MNASRSLRSASRNRRGRARRRTDGSAARAGNRSLSQAGLAGGRYSPLNTRDLGRIDSAVREILTTIGMSEASESVVQTLTARGCTLNDSGRLLFSSNLIGEALDGLTRSFQLHGQVPGNELSLSDRRVHVGTGGAAPSVVDLATGRYRDATLKDLYDAARLTDRLDNVHFFSRSLVARDMTDDLSLDINTAYACLRGTSKHVLTSVSRPEHVRHVAKMCYMLAGSREAFVERPFLSLNVNHVVPPLRLAGDACGVMAEAVRLGLPVHANTFGQVGASTPVTLAGAIAQTTAETLAGMIYAWVVNPQAKVTFGARPMVVDLRTGAMSGGGGEQAVLAAGATQMAQFYGLANTCIAGATDSKIADAQSGYEKCLSVTLAAQAGSNMITQACGMQASLLGCSFASYVIDNDMLGGILRSISPVEVSAETLLTDTILDVVSGDGHFLGRPETFQRMESDYYYPQIADRRSPEDWEADGAADIRGRACAMAQSILDSHFPSHIAAEVDDQLRREFDIFLARQHTRPS